MTKNIKGIFEQITPENIKNIPIIQKSIDVFIQSLEDLSKESIDIKNVFENEKIREELIKIYINDLYQILSNAQNNREVIDAINRINSYYNGVEFYKKDVIINIVKYINEEHFITFKSFKESKGLVDAIKYVYELINTLFTSSNTETYEFILKENGPFQLDIKGSLPEEIYNNIVWPLAHPLGFVYIYVRYILLNLEDYFPELKITYITDKLEVRCFLENGQTITTPIITSRYDQTKIIKIENFEDISTKTTVYYLNNNTYLRQVTNRNGQTSVEWLNNDGSVYKSFAEHCSIYASYEAQVETTVGDEKLDNKEITENDVWARLYDENQFLNWRDIGYNKNWDSDGNYYPNGTENGRFEHRFAPSIEADLKELEGKYVLNYPIKNEHGNIIAYQPKKYINEVNPNYKVVPFVVSREEYIRQNKGNEDYTAKEHFIEIQTLKNQKQIEKTPNYTAEYSDALNKWFDIIQPSLKRKSWYNQSYIQQIKGEKTLPSDYFINLFQSVLNKTNYTQEELEFKLWLDTFILNELIGENGLFPSNSVEINSFNINEIGIYIGVRKLTNQEISSKQINGYKFDDYKIGDINQSNSINLDDIQVLRNIIKEYSSKTFADRQCETNFDIVYHQKLVDGEPVNLQYSTWECKKDIILPKFSDTTPELNEKLIEKTNLLKNDQYEYYDEHYNNYEKWVNAEVYRNNWNDFEINEITNQNFELYNNYITNKFYDEIETQEQHNNYITNKFYDEIYEYDDKKLDIIKIDQELNFHVEYDIENNDFLYIGEENKIIGSNESYITGKSIVYYHYSESFFNGNVKEIDNFDCGVYRNGQLLEDNNISALAA